MEHMNLLQRIESKSSSFSKGQKRLAEYITNNFDTAAYLTASKLGKEAGVSESTVVRFAYQLDYDGYPELQKAIQVIVKTNSNSMQRMSLSSKRYQEKGRVKEYSCPQTVRDCGIRSRTGLMRKNSTRRSDLSMKAADYIYWEQEVRRTWQG